MSVDKLFQDACSAFNYIMSNKGIMGSEQKHHIMYGVNIHGGLYVNSSFNGYEIRRIELN